MGCWATGVDALKYLIAPSAFKGSFSPLEVTLAIARGVDRCSKTNDVSFAPIADGGDGTVEALRIATGGSSYGLEVQGPLGEPVKATWLAIAENQIKSLKEWNTFVLEPNGPSLPTKISAEEAIKSQGNELAVLELASACGLAYIAPHQLNALDAHTLGAGQLIEHCFDLGYENIVLTVGGSASTDGGTGILTALGAKFLDENGNSLPPGGRHLQEIRTIDLSAFKRFHSLRMRVATDVTNPLLGESGAARIFGPQKGASPADIQILEAGLLNYADRLEQTTGKSARLLPGSGAAGGVPFGLCLALGATIISGFEWVSSLIKLEKLVEESDIVISAEGCLDSQSLGGKASGELARLCRQYGKRFWIVAGQVEEGVDWNAHGIEQAVAASTPGTFASLEDVTDTTFLLCSTNSVLNDSII